MVTTEQGQALAAQIGEVILPTAGDVKRNKDLRIFQTQVDRHMVDGFPVPIGVFEDGHIDTPLLEIAKTSGYRSGYQHKAVLTLHFIERGDQLWQQAIVGALLWPDRIGRKMCRADLDHRLRLGCQRKKRHQRPCHDPPSRPRWNKTQDHAPHVNGIQLS
ncbi:hypothetical protein D3C81_1679150 [compost metagenome]